MVYVISGILALIALFVTIVGLFKLIFNTSQPPEKIRQKHEGEDSPKYAFVKKYPEANVNNYWWTFFMTGGIISLALIILAFEWTTYESVKKDPLGEINEKNKFEVEPPQTQRKQKPPPPPPPKRIDEVENDQNVPEDLKVPNMDVEPDEVVETPDLPAEEEEEMNEKDVFIAVEEKPEFPGGKKELQRFLAKAEYPPIAKQNNIEGRSTSVLW